MAVSPYKAQVLQLPLSQNLTLIMQTTAHPMAVGDNACLHHVEISLVKEDIAQIAGQRSQESCNSVDIRRIQLPQSCLIVDGHRTQLYCYI